MLGPFARPASQAAPARSNGLGVAPRPGEGTLSAPAPLDRVIERLEEVVDQETAALRNRTAIDLKDFNNRKSQGLLELNRALRGLDNPPKDRTVTTRLAGLRAKLDVNRAVLETHLAAVREVATVLADAIRDAESDGTYSPSIGAGGGRL
jgi:hypothetical protein